MAEHNASSSSKGQYQHEDVARGPSRAVITRTTGVVCDERRLGGGPIPQRTKPIENPPPWKVPSIYRENTQNFAESARAFSFLFVPFVPLVMFFNDIKHNPLAPGSCNKPGKSSRSR